MRPLIKARLRQMVNAARSAGKRKFGVFIALGFAILGVMSFFFIKIFGFLYHENQFPPAFKLFISEKILMMAFLTMFMMLVLSALSSTLNIFFLSRDLPLLLSSPLPSRTVFLWKSLEVAASSSLMVIFFSMPVLFSYAWFFAPGFFQVLAILPPFLCYIVSGLGVGVALGLIIPSVISVRKLQPVLSVISILFISGVVIFLRLLRPEKFANPGAITDMLQYMQGLRVDFMSYFPFAWAAGALKADSSGDFAGYWSYTGALAAAAGLLAGFIALIQKKFYLRLFDKLHRGGGGVFKSKWKPSALVPGAFAPFWKKELKTFQRSPELWSQLLIIIAIVIVFILNIKGMPLPHPSAKNIIAFLNIGMSALIVAGLNSRFAFPALPLENPGLAHVLASPCRREILFRFKLVFYAVPAAILGLSLFLAGDIALGIDNFARLSGYIFLIPLLPILTLLSLYYSLRIDNTVPLTPQHLLISRSGVFYMLWSLAWVLAGMAYMIRPMAVFYLRRFFNREIPSLEIALWYAGFILIHLTAAVFLYKRSLKLWKNQEFFY